jgi:beta-phosphoglucomutase-like phosphatase (HAD superfamily)
MRPPRDTLTLGTHTTARIRRIPPVSGASSLRLPEAVDACLFDMDGVLTDTAGVHPHAWKEMFALAGVAAGPTGGLGLVVGVDRVGRARALSAHSANVVVSDFGELLG